MSVKLKTLSIPDFIHNQYSTEYHPRDNRGAYKPLAAIYLLRLAIGLQSQMTIEDLSSLFTGGLAKLTGLTERQAGITNTPKADEGLGFDESNEQNPTITKAKLIKEIKSHLKQMIKKGMAVDAPLFTTLTRLGKTFGLTTTDQEILVLPVLMCIYPDFNGFLEQHWRDVSHSGLNDFLHLLTVRPIKDIEHSLAPNSTLKKLGWLTLEPITIDLAKKLALTPIFLDALLETHDSVASMFNRFFKTISPSNLTLANTPQLKQELEVIVPYLQAALETKQAGVNILVHAGAGAETIEFINVITQQLGATLVKINDLNPDGKPMPQQYRLYSCQLTQEYLKKQPQDNLILIDAAEHLFTHREDWMCADDDNNFNVIDEISLCKQLHNNPVPILWLFNKPVGIVPDIFKRFSYTWDISKIPVGLRQQLIEQATTGLNVSQQWVNQLAKQTDIQLEQITSAAAVAKLSQPKSTNTSEKLMLNTLNAKRRLYKQSPVQNPVNSHTCYDLRFTNTSIQLSDLIAGLSQSPQGNFCFYGAPGTGKTAFANFIAEQLGLPLMIKRASDLMDKYMGESEKNIARMFNDAQQQDAILLLDEADSLLGDRRDAHRSWEISPVNEMLTQMERYSGILICTTNLMGKLDAASLRRFDFKVKFDYLNSNQRWELFVQESGRMGSNLPSVTNALAALKQGVQRLTQLTPGDFAVANRQASLLGKPLTPELMLAVLQQECEAKGERFSQIGFVH